MTTVWQPLALCVVGAAICACGQGVPAATSAPTPPTLLTEETMEVQLTPLASIAVGAIRWDAWHSKLGEPGRAVERSLGPAYWHTRLPFFAEVVSETEVVIQGATQEVMDREIGYASAAGLDYWAFVTYEPDSPMSLGLQHYLSSQYVSAINFCMIVEGTRIGSGGLDGWNAKVERYLSYFREPTYQRVAGERPLLYIFTPEHMVGEGAFASWEEARTAFAALRSASQEAGLGDPYIVMQHWVAGQARMTMQFLRGDAISAYASSGGALRAPYAALAAHTEQWWDEMRDTGAPVIPLVSSGWDRRPRVENPVPWEGQRGSLDEYYERPTPEELATHLAHALDWVDAHPDAAEARAVLIYAWNENDEGGWIVPTLAEGTAHLDAISTVLKARDGRDAQ